MKAASLIKKRLKLLLVFSLIIIGVSLALELSTQYFFPKELIKQIAKNELSKSFRREVNIGSISGSPFSGVIAKDVKIASFDTLENGHLFSIDQMNITIDWIKLIKTQNFINSIKKLHCN